jgi:hypothetical protein
LRAGPLTRTPYSYFVTTSRKFYFEKAGKMIPYMDLNEQVDAHFTRARRRARLRALVARIRREHTSNRLLPFDDVRRELVANNRLHRGTRVVEVDRIVGSVGRYDEFDRSFLPARASIRERWKRIARAFHRGDDLPPVELYKLGEAYFVVDGHPRVSVARYHDVPTVEAAVVEFHPKLPAALVPMNSKSLLTA